MYYGFGLFGMTATNLIININYIFSNFIFIAYVFVVTYQLDKDESYNEECIGNYLLLGFICLLYSIFQIRFAESNHRQSFYNDQRIQKLLLEQRDVFENLPDGLIVHNKKDKTLNADESQVQDINKVQIKYLNKTFREMFLFEIMQE